MLLPSTRLLQTSVMSLQTGGELAHTQTAIINPENLMIMAFELQGHLLEQHPSYLLVEDIREISNLGIIVDSNEEFVTANDVVKLDSVIALGFVLINKTVRSDTGAKLGKVSDYAFEPGSFMIKQLVVRRPLLKSFSDTELLIDRTQIIEIDDTKIVVKHDEREPAPAKRAAANNFVNPFRGQTPAQPEAISRSDQEPI